MDDKNDLIWKMAWEQSDLGRTFVKELKLRDERKKIESALETLEIFFNEWCRIKSLPNMNQNVANAIIIQNIQTRIKQLKGVEQKNEE